MNLFNEYKLHHIEKSECTLETYEVAVKLHPHVTGKFNVKVQEA